MGPSSGGGKGPGPDLGVGLGAQVAAVEGLRAVQEVAQLLRVGQVAVVDEVDAQGGVDKEGLGLLRRQRPCGGVPHMPQPRLPCIHKVHDECHAQRQRFWAGARKSATSDEFSRTCCLAVCRSQVSGAGWALILPKNPQWLLVAVCTERPQAALTQPHCCKQETVVHPSHAL